jgi:hypothetical protein
MLFILGQTVKSAFTNHYYQYSSFTTSFDDALRRSSEATFAGVQGHLFVPNTYTEFRHVVYGNGWIVHVLWLGFTDSAQENVWTVAAGPYAGQDVSDMMWWWPGEPQGGRSENCVVYYPHVAEFGDFGCGANVRFAIEFECPIGQQFNNQGTACVGMTFSKHPSTNRSCLHLSSLSTPSPPLPTRARFIL